MADDECNRKVLGDGPRIPPLEVDELSASLREIVTRMDRVNAALGSRDYGNRPDWNTVDPAATPPEELAERVRTLPEIVRTWLRHPDLFACETELGIQLLVRGALPPRDRELAILRIAWLCQAPYEWGEHVIVAKKVGITSAEIERVTQGAAAAGWNAHERAILSAVEELHAGATLSDATWAVLAASYDDRQLIELPILIGQYQTVAYYQNALRLRLHRDNTGLTAR